MTTRRAIPFVIGAAFGALLFAVGPLTLHEPFGSALWAIVCVIVLLPLAFEGVHIVSMRYAIAVTPVIVGIAIVAGLRPAIVVAAVASSLVGGAMLLTAIRLPAIFAIALNVLGASLAFTWPIWSAGILSTHDLGPWLQRAIDVSPAFALNGAIAPDDPLTHRQLAYKLMNLGQDVNYAMPTSVWRCVLVHAGMGLFGLFCRRWTRMNADHSESEVMPTS